MHSMYKKVDGIHYDIGKASEENVFFSLNVWTNFLFSSMTYAI